MSETNLSILIISHAFAMSTTKRPRPRQPEAQSASPQPNSKKLKTSSTTHVPTKSGLDFLVDEDARAGGKVGARLTNGVPGAKTSRVDESHALVAPDTKDEEDNGPVINGNRKMPEIIELSSAEEESSAYESSEDEAEDGVLAAKLPLTNGHVSPSEEDVGDVELGAEDHRMQDADGEVEDVARAGDVEANDQEEPSFGDLLRQRHPGAVDVHASLPDRAADRNAVIATSSTRALTAPNSTSLGTVLTQALKTNDKDMLESCIQVTDLPTIRATIERLQSPLAAALLQRLAERIHKAPGRTGHLMIWIQWTLVTHGGYLSSQMEVVGKLKALSQVVRERASGLQPLLQLKGKLDMLSAQLEHRKNMHEASRVANAEDEEDEGAVLYVEGRDDDWSEEEDDEMAEDDAETKLLEPAPSKARVQLPTPRSDAEADDDESADEIPNGVVRDAVEDTSDEEAEPVEGLFDEEADETSDDDAEEASSDEDGSSGIESENDASDISEDDSEVEVKALPPQKLNRKR
ncbi:Small subunit (SSU) processome component [Teratosphaeriaceae sp. CCFEE 6253]|nr:Small subunit (SSU) processome component [Teratosphaeriaceae sp. CCFEE 6253]